MSNIARTVLVGMVFPTISAVALAQSYPVKPVKVIVPAGPGGPDVVARIVAANFTRQMGQTFFVENHGGAYPANPGSGIGKHRI